MFSKSAEYALRATIYIARKSAGGKKVGLAEIAKAVDAPLPFTAKILQQMVRSKRVLRSIPGPNGGFFLTEKARQSPVMQVLKSVGEDEQLAKCILGLKKCSDKMPCPMHATYKLIKQQLIDLFETTSIGELADDIEKQDLFINNRKKMTGN